MIGREGTIVALSTAAGRGAIAIVRMSGPEAHGIARRHLESFPNAARTVILSPFRTGDGEIIDHPLITRYDAPASYTGEDLVELSTHGGLVTPTRVIEQLVLSGARVAEPGEFTRRAFLNGKMDLLQVEAVGDLIDAGTRAMARAAVNQLDRGLSRRIERLRESVLQVEALLAYDIDFPEEDEGPISRERITAATDECLRRIDELLSTAATGELLRAGAVVVIAGPPNAGKSSLFNALIGRARAIVTEVPGTTRDALEAVVEGARWPLRLVDTAGLRETTDTVERLGVELSETHIREAEVVVACGESADQLRATIQRARELAPASPVVPVQTKVDRGDGEARIDGVVRVSALTGEGLRPLLERIEAEVDQRRRPPRLDAPVLTRARHAAALRTARQELQAFSAEWARAALPATVVATHLRAAAGALEDLIGVVDVEDVLTRVFSQFCIGK